MAASKALAMRDNKLALGGYLIARVLVQTGGEAEASAICKDALFIERDGVPGGRYSSILEPESAEIELALADAAHQLDA
jgi:hypothetical protein